MSSDFSLSAFMSLYQGLPAFGKGSGAPKARDSTEAFQGLQNKRNLRHKGRTGV